nr:hypothetical protein [uncultured Ralstonia sp.]
MKDSELQGQSPNAGMTREPATVAAELVDDGKPARDERGRLLPGHKGLPGAGRPSGLAQSEKIRALLEPHREELIGRTLELALKSPDGQVSARALEIALTRLAPTPRQEAERVIVPGFREATTLQGKAEAIIAAAACGEISAEAAERLLRVLDVYSKAILTTELERRLQALEQGRTTPPGSAASEPTGAEDLV